MRRGIDALTQHIEGLNLRWQEEAAFVFCNKARSCLKILRWDCHGIWMTREVSTSLTSAYSFIRPTRSVRFYISEPNRRPWVVRVIQFLP
ncbi:IS66 family insertion sequence element accessory protein TnpB [Xenorhabdus bovienii]